MAPLLALLPASRKSWMPFEVSFEAQKTTFAVSLQFRVQHLSTATTCVPSVAHGMGVTKCPSSVWGVLGSHIADFPLRSISSKRPRPQLPARRNRRQNSQIRLFSLPKTKKTRARKARCRLGRAPASPSTLNTPLHTLNCTAFTIASAADNVVLKGPSPRAV